MTWYSGCINLKFVTLLGRLGWKSWFFQQEVLVHRSFNGGVFQSCQTIPSLFGISPIYPPRVDASEIYWPPRCPPHKPMWSWDSNFWTHPKSITQKTQMLELRTSSALYLQDRQLCFRPCFKNGAILSAIRSILMKGRKEIIDLSTPPFGNRCNKLLPKSLSCLRHQIRVKGNDLIVGTSRNLSSLPCQLQDTTCHANDMPCLRRYNNLVLWRWLLGNDKWWPDSPSTLILPTMEKIIPLLLPYLLKPPLLWLSAFVSPSYQLCPKVI